MRYAHRSENIVISRFLSGVLAKWRLIIAVSLICGVLPTQILFANPMIHNSTTLGSGYWSGAGGWGVTGGKYGAFTCGTCHARNTGNIKRVKTSLSTPDSSSWEGPAATSVTVNFQAISGANSFGDDGRGDLTSSDKICEACHSQTTVHRYDSSGITDFNHKNANQTDCMICHPHKQGFTPLACDSCHGYPPTALDQLVSGVDATGSTTFGAHAQHAVTLGYSCEHCHNGYVMPNSGDIDIHFSNFGSVTGTYSGQVGVDYNASAGTGGLTCDTVYCHSTGQSSNGSSATPSAYSTPAWDGSVSCGSCHNANDPGTGSHTAHLNDGAGCENCHSDAVAGTTAPTDIHVNRAMNVYDSAAGDLGYTAGGVPGNGYGNCTSVSCHDDGRNSGVTQAWGAVVADCGECHAVQPATGSHATHLALFNCGTCHDGAVESSNGGTSHRSGDVNLLASTGLSSPRTLGDTFTSCSTNNCHGSNSPIWGTDLSSNDECTQCHGQLVASASDAQKAPGGSGIDTNGDSAATDAQVGAHQIHLNPTMSAAVACSACHAVPGTITAAGHIDSALPAELTFSGLALGGLDGQSAVSPANSQAGCATTYCHDGAALKNGGTWDNGSLAPVWTNTGFIAGSTADCDNCHGYPPATGHPQPATNCNVCHANTVAGTNDGFTDPSLHVNGTVEASDVDNCSDCHTSLSNDHSDHVDYSYFLAGKTISGGDYGKAAGSGTNGFGWYDVEYVSGAPLIGCGQCHPAAEGVSHPINGLNVDVDGSDELAALTPLAPNPKLNNSSPNYTSNQCSGVYCHSDGAGNFDATPPAWGTDTIDNCKGCHGNSPTTNAHSLHEVGIHYESLLDDDRVGLMAKGTADIGLADGEGGNYGAGAAHGNSAQATTLTCYTCHKDTVADTANAGNTTCLGCHSDTDSIITGDEMGRIASDSWTHINGQADVSFVDLSTFKSKAQLRNDITNVAEVDASWARYNSAGLDNTAYKQATSYDLAKNAVPLYNSADMSCSTVDCHNGIKTPTWDSNSNNCMSCHTALPQ